MAPPHTDNESPESTVPLTDKRPTHITSTESEDGSNSNSALLMKILQAGEDEVNNNINKTDTGYLSDEILSAAAAEGEATMNGTEQQEHDINNLIQGINTATAPPSDTAAPSNNRTSHKEDKEEDSQAADYIRAALANSTHSLTGMDNQSDNSSPNEKPSRPPPTSHKQSPSDSSFNMDASISTRKKGTGYLASQMTLSTPTDVFAAGCTLLQLCAIGNLQAVKEYVNGVFDNVNFRDYDRRTALHVASSEGCLDVVKYLVSKGANVNRSDRWGGSPLDDAHRHRHQDVAKYLRSKGAKTGSLNLTSNLIAAAAAGDIEEVRMICGDGKNVSQLALDLSGSKHRNADGERKRPGSPTKKASFLDISSGFVDTSNVDINKGDYDKRTGKSEFVLLCCVSCLWVNPHVLTFVAITSLSSS